MSFNVRQVIDKMGDPDKDYRFMACNDLLSEMGKDGFQLDSDSQKQLIKKILELVVDSSNEVQGLAVRCLGQLVKGASDAQVEEIVDNLCGHLEKAGSTHRDVATLGLKSVITELTSASGAAKTIGKKLTPRILKTASDESSSDVQMDALDVLQEMLKKFGNHMIADQEKVLAVLLAQLASPRSIVRKRAVVSIGFLALSLNDKLLADLIKAIIANIKGKGKPALVRANVQAISAVSRSSGSRIAKYVKELATLILTYVENDEGVESEDDEELRENCFAALESFIIRTPSEVLGLTNEIIKASLVYVKHDPNYAYDDDEEEAEPSEEDEDDDGETYGDEDDVSWKVRRAAAKTLSALISTRADLLPIAYEKVSPVLIKRFSEREENVQEDIFNTYIDILHQTGVVSRHDTTAKDRLVAVIPSVVAQASRQLKNKSQKTRTCAFTLLRELVNTIPGCLKDSISSIVPGIAFSLQDKKAGAPLKIAVLSFINTAINTHDATVFQPHAKALAPLLFATIGDSYYKTAADALRNVAALVQVIRPETGKPGAGFDFKPFVKDAYESTLKRLKVLDIDQDVKDASIYAMGVVLSRFGDELKGELSTVLPILLERLRNEITRLAAVQALTRISSSFVQVDLSPILDDTFKELAQLLRKNHRPLKQASLLALDALVARYGKAVNATLHNGILVEVATLVSDSDLFLAHLALRLTVTTLKNAGSNVSAVNEKVLPRALEIVQSPLLQGVALESLLAFFGELVVNKTSGQPFDKLFAQLQKIAEAKKSEDMSQQAMLPVAKSIAELVSRASSTERDATVKKLVESVRGSAPMGIKLLNLLTVGEIGSKVDLSGVADVQSTIMGAFESDLEELKSAGSYALGAVAAGNLEKFLPVVLNQIKTQPKRQYLLLHSLREIVSSPAAQGGAMTAHVGTILDMLFAHCANAEEGVRNVVAECIGKLALVSPDTVVPAMVKLVGDSDPLARGTIVSAVKFTITEQPQPVDQALAPVMSQFLGMIGDADLLVRRAALLSMNAVCHRKPVLARPHLKTVLPALYNETRIKPELIREIIVGPFKHQVDDGLENRKAAFEVMSTLLETSIDLIDFAPFLVQVASGLADHVDIKTLCHFMLERLARIEGPACLAAVDQLVEPLQKTVTTKLKDSAVAQDIERNEELIKGALRAVASLSRVANIDSSVRFMEFVTSVIIKGDGTLPQKYQEILKETSSDQYEL